MTLLYTVVTVTGRTPVETREGLVVMKVEEATKQLWKLLFLYHKQLKMWEKCCLANTPKKKRIRRLYLLKVFQSVLFLARQGLPLRGDGNDEDSNLKQLRSHDDPTMRQHMEKSAEKYTSHDIQNEILDIMALTVTREICSVIRRASYYTIMADEVTDASNREQVAVCFRWVDDDFECHEDFVGVYIVDSIEANVVVAVLKDVILRMNLELNKCCGQCYDGASNMAGIRNGAATQILKDEPRAVYTHCYGHALNLVACDTVRNNKILRDALDTTNEISKLLKFSPRRDTLFEKIKSEIYLLNYLDSERYAQPGGL